MCSSRKSVNDSRVKISVIIKFVSNSRFPPEPSGRTARSEPFDRLNETLYLTDEPCFNVFCFAVPVIIFGQVMQVLKVSSEHGLQVNSV